MSFREKSAWIILITLIVLTTLFVLHMPPPYSLAPEPSPATFGALMIMVGLFVGVIVIGHIVIAVLAPRDATTASDEREKLIALKATSIAAHVYAFLTLGGIFVALHLVGTNAIGLGYLIFFAFIAAEIVNYAMRVIYYRRGF